MRRLRAAADAAGVTMDRIAADLIAEGLAHDWTEALDSLAEYDRTGVSYSRDEAMAVFDTAVETHFAAKR